MNDTATVEATFAIVDLAGFRAARVAAAARSMGFSVIYLGAFDLHNLSTPVDLRDRAVHDLRRDHR